MKRKFDSRAKEKPTEVKVFFDRSELELLDHSIKKYGGKRSPFVKSVVMQKLVTQIPITGKGDPE